MSRDLPGQVFLPGCAPRGQELREYRADTKGDAAAERRRVAGEVSKAVVAFCRLRIHDGHEVFRMSELTAFVQARVMCAPDSAGRILRQLAQQGALEYELVSRAESRYRICSVSEGAES